MEIERLPILYYRKLKSNPKVWIPSMQMNVVLNISSDEDVFVGITQYSANYPIYFGFIESKNYPSEAFDRVELELGENDFADDKKYTKEEVEQILRPLMYTQNNLC